LKFQELPPRAKAVAGVVVMTGIGVAASYKLVEVFQDMVESTVPNLEIFQYQDYTDTDK
jgi:hypothetical protein